MQKQLQTLLWGPEQSSSSEHAMLVTIIPDVFPKTEFGDIAAALDDLCSPLDSWGWSSAGVYAFWNPKDGTLLYVGLAVDLPQRFRQHTGLIAAPESGCKKEEINAYFQNNQTLGYSVLVQSPMDQPLSARALAAFGSRADSIHLVHGDSQEAGRDTIKLIEGRLLAGIQDLEGALPPWNKVRGSLRGLKGPFVGLGEVLDGLRGVGGDPLRSHATLRELTTNIEFFGCEEWLHGVRSYMIIRGVSWETALKELPDPNGRCQTIARLQYLRRAAISPEGS